MDDDLKQIAEYHAQMVNPGMWAEMSDKQRATARRNVWQWLTNFIRCVSVVANAVCRKSSATQTRRMASVPRLARQKTG
jgi:hypothetical protein